MGACGCAGTGRRCSSLGASGTRSGLVVVQVMMMLEVGVELGKLMMMMMVEEVLWWRVGGVVLLVMMSP